MDISRSEVLRHETAPPRRWGRWLVRGLLIVILLGLIGFWVLSHSPKLSAMLADNVLRPIIGDRNVVRLEGTVFNLQDKVNQVSKKDPNSADFALAAPTTTNQDSGPAPTTKPNRLSLTVDRDKPLPEEGVWVPIAGGYLHSTFIRTDADRPYAVVNLVYISKAAVAIGGVAGTVHPGGPNRPGPGSVPESIQQSGKLIAAFNGGFREKDGNYGMYADGVTYQPFHPNLATFSIYKDDHVTLNSYDGRPLDKNIVLARQNGPLLLKDGQIMVTSDQGIDMWAGTAKGGFHTWRSALGILPNGDLVYAVGPSLSPTSLAAGLQAAGAVNAMQLDINTYWVRFMLYTPDGQGSYNWSPLIKGLAGEGPTYLKGNQKDFFYLYKK